MLFLQGVHVCTAWRNSIFCTVLRYKMLLLQAVHVCTPWSNSFFARFCTGCPCQFDWFAQPVGFPSKGAEQAPGIPFSLRNASKPFFLVFSLDQGNSA